MFEVKADSELDLAELKRLLQRVQKSIHQAPDEARSQMNSFVIAVGSYVKPLTDTAIEIGEKIGPVTVDMGDTACQVPFAPDSIRKVRKRRHQGRSARRRNAERPHTLVCAAPPRETTRRGSIHCDLAVYLLNWNKPDLAHDFLAGDSDREVDKLLG